jgi:hypothetical protein
MREATEEELRAQRAGYVKAEMGTDRDEDRERQEHAGKPEEEMTARDWHDLPIGAWFFADNPECTNRYSVQERTSGGCTLVCSTSWHHEQAKRDMQSIAEVHNDAARLKAERNELRSCLDDAFDVLFKIATVVEGNGQLPDLVGKLKAERDAAQKELRQSRHEYSELASRKLWQGLMDGRDMVREVEALRQALRERDDLLREALDYHNQLFGNWDSGKFVRTEHHPACPCWRCKVEALASPAAPAEEKKSC